MRLQRRKRKLKGYKRFIDQEKHLEVAGIEPPWVRTGVTQFQLAQRHAGLAFVNHINGVVGEVH